LRAARTLSGVTKPNKNAAGAHLAGGSTVGQVRMLPLASVQPNGYNPNRMTDRIMESLKHGLREQGWLMSQSLLVWGTDDTGQQRNVIIDGEHRWRAAQACGFVEGPMVVLDGLSEREAKKLTVAMNQKRGDWDETALAALLRDVQDVGVSTDELGLDLGFDVASLDKLLASAPAPPPVEGDKPPENQKPPEFVEKFIVMVICPDEKAQTELIARMTEEGREVRALTT
jgi:ParB-like chromosome segregation protein Spo0J